MKRMGLRASAFAAFALLAGAAQGAVVYVNWNNAGGTWDGKTWATAFPDVQMGIDDALSNVTSNREVWVAVSAPAVPAYVQAITLKSGVAVYGGFAGNETARSQRNPKANPTILEAPGNTVVSTSARGFVLDGFTIRNGAQGIIITAGYGTIANCIVSGVPNTGLIVTNGAANVTNCVVRGNGLGVAVSGGAMTVVNCTVYGNAFGVYQMDKSWMSVTSCIVTKNSTGLQTDLNGDQPRVSRCNVFNNTANYGNFYPRTGQDGNISIDPLFSSAGTGDFHLLTGSPCIDTGDDSAVLVGSVDADGRPRVAGVHVDMGAYEYNPAFLTKADVTSALRIAGGLSVSAAADLARLNADAGSARIDLRDALRLARKVAGVEGNP